MKITAATVRERGRSFTVEELELDDPRSDEVLVEICGVGLCHTDLAAAQGFFRSPLPSVFGHEGSGVVAGVGSAVRTVAPGDHVALSFGSCGSCSACSSDDPSYCRRFAQLNLGSARSDGSTALSTSAGEQVGAHFFGQSSFASHALASE